MGKEITMSIFDTKKEEPKKEEKKELPTTKEFTIHNGFGDVTFVKILPNGHVSIKKSGR